MKLLKSNKIKRTFFMGDKSEPVKGVPQFTSAEIAEIGELNLGVLELIHLFDSRSKSAIPVKDCLKDFYAVKESPQEEIGYQKAEEYRPAPKDWPKKIRETIEETKIKG